MSRIHSWFRLWCVVGRSVSNSFGEDGFIDLIGAGWRRLCRGEDPNSAMARHGHWTPRRLPLDKEINCLEHVAAFCVAAGPLTYGHRRVSHLLNHLTTLLLYLKLIVCFFYCLLLFVYWYTLFCDKLNCIITIIILKCIFHIEVWCRRMTPTTAAYNHTYIYYYK